MIDEAKSKANQILRDATDEAKRVAVETEDLKRQTRVFHQRLVAAIEGQLSLTNSPEWTELLQPTAVYLQNSDAAFREVVEKVLEERPDNYNKAITWNRRFNMYLEKMKSGNVFEVADVIRTLQVQENEKKLSTGERRLLGTARQILISEVMLVKNAEQQDIENWLNKFF